MKMKSRPFLLWLAALFLTLASAFYQRVTGPTYPLKGTVTLQGSRIDYRLPRSHDESDALVEVPLPDSTARGWLEWKRYPTDEPWSRSIMVSRGGVLSGTLPVQPPSGKVAYRLLLQAAGEVTLLPGDEPVILRFTGTVPKVILWPHIILMFLAMLFSTRAGLEIFSPRPRLRLLSFLTLAFLVAGGAILGPIVQKFAFGAYWTGWPIGGDLTDNKTALALLAWVAAVVALYRSGRPERWALGAAIVLLLVYLIPHSLLGSQLNYKSGSSTGAHAPPSLLR